MTHNSFIDHKKKIKVLAANIDTTGEPRIDGKLPKSTVVTVGGRRIGIIGYVTEETSVRYIGICAPANINKTFSNFSCSSSNRESNNNNNK